MQCRGFSIMADLSDKQNSKFFTTLEVVNLECPHRLEKGISQTKMQL